MSDRDHQVLVYGDSLSWGIVPGTRERFGHGQRWPGVLEAGLGRAGHAVRVIEDCLNGRRTVFDDPAKAGRNGLVGLEQRVEVNSPLALVVLMLGTNDFQAVHDVTPAQSAEGVRALIGAVREAPVEPGMRVPPVLVVAPPPVADAKGEIAAKFEGAAAKAVGLTAAMAAVAKEEGCAFFDAGSVTATSRVDGVHLDVDQHLALGEALVEVVASILQVG